MISATKIKAKIEQAKQANEDSIYKESVDSICRGIDKTLKELPEDYIDSYASCAVIIERGRLFANWSSVNQKSMQEMLRIPDHQTGGVISTQQIRNHMYPILTTQCLALVKQEVIKHGYTSITFEYDADNVTNDTIVVRLSISWEEVKEVKHEMLLETAPPISHITNIVNEHNSNNSHYQDNSDIVSAMLVADVALGLIDILE